MASRDKPQPPSLPVASVLSDLTSLRVCDYESARALVTASSRRNASIDNPSQPDAEPWQSSDPDMERARTLLNLYQTVKVDYTPAATAGMGEQKGRSSEYAVSYDAHGTLAEARAHVARAVALLEER